MELRVLKYFLVVAREESITKAADLLYITQPTLSRQIAELEEEIGTTLFIRSNRNVTLTDAGILFRRRVEEILSLEEKIKSEFSEKEEKLSGTIGIGMAESLSANIVAEIIKDFKKKYPFVKFELFTAMADQVQDRIDRGILDVGFLLEPVNVNKYDFIRLSVTERLGVVMRTDDQLAKNEEIVPEDLLDFPVVVPMRNELKQNTRNFLGTIYDKYDILASFNVVNNALLLAENGTARVIVVEGATQYHKNPNICFRPFKLVPELGCLVIWKKYQPSDRVVSRFLEEVAMLSEHSKS